MSAIEIRPAKREGARLVIMLAGVSGSGKTYTALELALGLALFDPSKIGFIDAENRRGSLYADVYQARADRPSDVPFLIGDLYAPFSPQRYIDAIHAFQKAGVEVLVIDSGSHEWEGIGGCIDIAEAGNPRMPNWNKAKAEHKKFMNTLLTCDMHVILCLRAREKSKPEEQIIDNRKKTVYVNYGLQPITEGNVLFEATASLMLHDEGRRQDVIKCPGALQAILGREKSERTGYITADDGQAIRRWVDGAQQLDPNVEKYRNRLLSITDKGKAYVEESWGKVPAAIRTALGDPFKATLIASAAEYEKQIREAKDDGGAADINAAIAGATGPEPVVADNDNAPPEQAAGSGNTEPVEQIF